MLPLLTCTKETWDWLQQLHFNIDLREICLQLTCYNFIPNAPKLTHVQEPGGTKFLYHAEQLQWHHMTKLWNSRKSTRSAIFSRGKKDSSQSCTPC